MGKVASIKEFIDKKHFSNYSEIIKLMNNLLPEMESAKSKIEVDQKKKNDAEEGDAPKMNYYSTSSNMKPLEPEENGNDEIIEAQNYSDSGVADSMDEEDDDDDDEDDDEKDQKKK